MNNDAANAASSVTGRPRTARRIFSAIYDGFARDFTRKKHLSAAVREELDRLLGIARREYTEKKFADTLGTCDLMLELDPENFFALRYGARIHSLNGEFDRAEIIWRRLCAGPRKDVEPAINVARLAERRGQWETVAEFADLALREDPERSEGLRMAILGRVQTERYTDLFDLLPRLYSIEPERALGFLRDFDNPDTLPGFAEAYMRMAQSTLRGEALEVLRERSHKVWLVAARRAIAAREDNLTSCYLRIVLIFVPSSQEAIDGLAVITRESLVNLRRAIKKCDRPAAIYHAEITAEINPALVEAWFSLARLIENDDPDRAARAFRTCANLRPEEAYYQVRVGRALWNTLKLDQALTAFERARTLSTADSGPSSTGIVAAIEELKPLVLRRGRELLIRGQFRLAWAHFYAASGVSQRGAALLGFPAPAPDVGSGGSQE